MIDRTAHTTPHTNPQAVLAHPWLGSRAEWAWGFTVLHAFRDPIGVVDLAAARAATTTSIPDDTWRDLIAHLTRDGLLTLRGLTPHLHPLPQTGSAFGAAWRTFEASVPTLRGRTIAAYRSDVARALEDAGFTVEQDASARSNVNLLDPSILARGWAPGDGRTVAPDAGAGNGRGSMAPLSCPEPSRH